MERKKIIVLIFLLVSSHLLLAQQHDNVWLIGQETSSSTMLSFNGGVLQIDSVSRNLPMFRTAVSVSDSLGNLIFYSNGIKINNAQYQLMENGDSLNPGQVATDNENYGYVLPNSIISSPHPVRNNMYYLFHQSTTYASEVAGFCENLYYTLIDMNANNGLGKVVKKNKLLASDSLCKGQLQMVKHANGRDWWIVQPMAWTNGFYTFLITSDTIELVHKQYIGNLPIGSGQEWLGQAVFSPDGSKYARYDFKNDLNIFDFDRCTGMLSNSLHIPIQDTIDAAGGTFTGVAISSSNQYLYVCSWNLLYQFDLWSSNIAASKDTVAVHDGYVGTWGPTIFRCLKLAPDNKIYIMSDNFNLHTIESPDSGGVSCNVQQRSVTVPYFLYPYFPNHPHYRTPPLAGSPCDTLTSIPRQVPHKPTASIKLYPNPASSQITIEASQPIERIVLYNALGQEVQTIALDQAPQSYVLPIQHLPQGMYWVAVHFGDVVLTEGVQLRH